MRPRLVAAAELAAFIAIVVALLWAFGRLWEPVRIGGLSMHPTLHVGDVAIVARHERPMVGDVVLVRSVGHESVLHRVVGFTPTGAVVTQGDANVTADRESARPQDVVGRAIVIVRVGALIERWRGRDEYATIAAQSNTQQP